MTGERVSYSGRRLSLDDARMVPKPVQRPHPPIWIGGSGPRRTIPLVARWADVWHAFGTPESLTPLSQQIDRLAEDAGRDPASIRRASVLSLSEPLDDVRRTTEAGAARASTTWSVLGPRRTRPGGGVRATVDPEFA
jgi:alkanesulfonate monooxygenase SsuD/methylene tetrahydromethanopterin reductase-like flavin-dependent oxidoreductase (luciferase family)